MYQFVMKEQTFHHIANTLSGLWLFVILDLVPTEKSRREPLGQQRLAAMSEVCYNVAGSCYDLDIADCLYRTAALLDSVKDEGWKCLPRADHYHPVYIVAYGKRETTAPSSFGRASVDEARQHKRSCQEAASDVRALGTCLEARHRSDSDMCGVIQSLRTSAAELDRVCIGLACFIETTLNNDPRALRSPTSIMPATAKPA
ncbi:unnamed protein product [Symbiodinium sp. CCMP2592]|nr:unnamed protein product [Symbiodinium sp. CCMP2592]